MPFKILTAASSHEALFVREVAVNRNAAHVRALGNVTDGGGREAFGLMQFDRCIDDPVTSLILALGAPLEAI